MSLVISKKNHALSQFIPLDYLQFGKSCLNLLHQILLPVPLAKLCDFDEIDQFICWLGAVSHTGMAIIFRVVNNAAILIDH